MKPVIILSIVGITITGLLLVNCNPASKNLMVVNYSSITPQISPVVKSETATAHKEIYSDFQKFIAVAHLQLDRNQTSFSKLQNMPGQIAENGNDKQIACLITENNNLRIKLDNYVESGTGNWKTFESEFSNTINDLEIASTNSQFNSINSK